MSSSEPEVKPPNPPINTIHRIYNPSDEPIVTRDVTNRRSFINRSQYAKLHRSHSSTNKRYSVGNLKGHYENLERQNSLEPKSPEPTKFTPEDFGYPKTAKLSAPLIKPKPAPRTSSSSSKDENSNEVKEAFEEVSVVLQPTKSVESVDKIFQDLSDFEMDGRSKDRKRGSFRKLFLGGLFTKDKKKKEEEKKKGDNNVYNDNLRNETNFVRTTQQPTVTEQQERRMRDLEEEYARLHVDRFQMLRRNFGDDRVDNYVIMDSTNTKPKRPPMEFPPSVVNKYIDTSSTDSDKPRDTPPRAQETNQNIKVVTPKAAIPLNTERALPNPYQNGKESHRTIERNLNRSNSKDYPDKASFAAKEDDYGTVFDSLDKPPVNGTAKPPINPNKPTIESLKPKTTPPVSPRPVLESPKLKTTPPVSPTRTLVESTKLRLPPNRQVFEPQPRVKSPIPQSRVSTDKLIATELLKATRSPTPPKRTDSVLSKEGKPPMSPKSPKKQEVPQFDTVVTSAQVHVPKRAETPMMMPVGRSTPVELRQIVSSKMSPAKEDVRKSVEEYYWKQLKKLKDEENARFERMESNEESRLRRSRSLSPNSQRVGRRSLSLPRDGRSMYVDYARVSPQQPIPEDHAMDVRDGRHFVYDNNFARNTMERRTIDSTQRPIFRRGSLSRQEIYEQSPYNKRVSFVSSQQQWPTRNGYTQSPPQRRVDKVDSETDDEVFIPMEPHYVNRPMPVQEPLYTNRVIQQFRAQAHPPPSFQPIYGQRPQMGARRLSMDSLPPTPDLYARRRPVSNVTYQQIQRFPSNNQLSLQRNPVYSSRQSMTDGNYGKQITVTNKYCDIYGQIHDNQTTGVVMGQYYRTPITHRPTTITTNNNNNENFVRGSRLTASANDIGKRYEYNEKIASHYEDRPLPPLPRASPMISDTESDVSDIQRRTKSKKKWGLFGK